MAASRVQTPVNLKERIAALQQRSVSPNTHQSAQAAPRGLPSPGSKGGLRDKIAKFEEKGGVPVPRGSFAMGAPQLAENAPSKKRGELYGNRVPGLGRPSGPPNMPSRAGSPCATGAEDGTGAAPRKRCISTGATLSSGTPSTFSTDEPVPALPNGLVGTQPRRNSLAVNFGSGRRARSTSDAEGAVVDFVEASSSSPSSPPPGKPPELAEPASASSVDESELPLEVTEDTPESAELPPVVEEQSLPPPSAASQADTPPEDQLQHPSPVSEVSQSPTKESLSDYESAPQSAGSHPSLSLPEPASATPPLVPIDAPSDISQPTPIPEETVVLSPPTSPPCTNNAISRVSTVNIHVPIPAEPVPPSIPSPILTTEAPTLSKSTFKAVVHRKVSEPPIAPASSSLAPPAALQITKQRRVSGKVVDVSTSPTHGDLAVLLEDAALLELKLTEGDSRTKDLTKTPTNATFEPDLRHASASTLTEHAPIPSVDSGSQSGGSVSIPSIREPLADGDIPEEEETDGRSLASTTFSGRSLSQRKYLSNIYRLGRRSSSYMPGAYPRERMSMSSEDSSPVATPSDNGKRKGFGIAWPSSSPKRDGSTMSRSSSFADKIFNRNRTRSNVSTADQVSERGSLYESSQLSLSLSFPAELSTEGHPSGVDVGARPTSWISTGDSNPEFSPASSFLDKDIFDAFPSVPQTLPPGFHLDADHGSVGRASTLPVNGRKQVSQRLSMV